MSTTTEACHHPPAARYWDTDEERCRVCTTSLTFPPRAPEPDDTTELKRDKRITAGEKHRVTAVEVAEVEVAEVEVAEVGLLRCSCCRLSLVPEDFSARNDPTAKNRAYRAWACRRCQAAKVRAKRESALEGFRERDRLRSAGRWAALTPARREAVKQKRQESREHFNAATRRYQARKKGVSIPLRYRGGIRIHTARCPISPGCPLGESCTIQAKGLKLKGS